MAEDETIYRGIGLMIATDKKTLAPPERGETPQDANITHEYMQQIQTCPLGIGLSPGPAHGKNTRLNGISFSPYPVHT